MKGSVIMMIYGYARVSTKGQQRDGYSLEDQRHILESKGCQKIIEEQYTGSTTHRPKFQELINELQNGDTLIVTKLDRFARTSTEGYEVAKSLLDRGVTLKIEGIGTIENTAAGRGILSIFLAFAQMEREMIIERTQAGKATARTKAGFKEGRPRTPKAQTDLAIKLVLDGHSYKQASEQTGISVSTIVRRMSEYRAGHKDNTKATPKDTKKRIERPSNWLEVYTLYKAHTITLKEAMKRLQLKRTTFYRLMDEYEATASRKLLKTLDRH